MFNVAVINLKSLIKHIVKIIIAVIVIAMIFNLFIRKSFIDSYSFHIACINLISSNIAVSCVYEEENEGISLGKLLGHELVIFGSQGAFAFEDTKPEVKEENSEIEETKEEVVENTPEDIHTLTTQVIEENNKVDKFTNNYGSVKIRNESKYELTEEMIRPTVDFNNKKDIIIFHTHTCESYTPTEKYNYVSTGNFRTTDLNFSVAHVGEVLTERLTERGYNVTHDQTCHDYPAYTGSYNRSYATVDKLISGDVWTEFVIDLHRDAMGSSSEYAPSVRIGDEIGAQLMFVIGTDGGGLEHPNWLNNFKLAVKIQEKANELYPGLFKPIILRNSRYNQNLASGACIIEVGATGNTLEQCEVSMKYLANVIAEIMK